MDSIPRRDAALDSLVNALRRITHAIRLSSSVVQDTLAITGAQLFVLQQLAEHPVTSLRDLAGRTLTDQSSVSVVVSRLVERGHVTRQVSAGDARRVELALTASGRALLRRAPELPQARLVATLRQTSLRDLAITARVLDRAAREIDGSPEQPAMFFEPAVSKPRRRSKVRTR
jgi:DNA-binding MarR family transcriptional regulator